MTERETASFQFASLELGAGPVAATAFEEGGFAERDFSDPDPPPLLHFWFGTHPTLSERISFAREYKKSRQ